VFELRAVRLVEMQLRGSEMDLPDHEIYAAIKRGQAARMNEPRARTARYDRTSGRIIVDLTNGCTFAFPAAMAEGLDTATDAQLAQVELQGAGYGLHWEDLDIDLSVPGLLAGLFGTRAFMARQAGQATSPAKAAATRSNGTLGRRPRKAVSNP
jgi:hypothetical protein